MTLRETLERMANLAAEQALNDVEACHEIGDDMAESEVNVRTASDLHDAAADIAAVVEWAAGGAVARDVDTAIRWARRALATIKGRR